MGVCVRYGLVLVILVAPSAAWAQTRDDDDDKKLPEKCAKLTEEKRRATDECKTASERRQDDYERRMKEAEEEERPERTSFLKWLHIDGLWTTTSLGSRTYGLVGAHLAVVKIKRLYLFGPPGVMLLMNNNDSQRVRPALTWGLSIQLVPISLPGTSREFELYLNLVKCWTSGSSQAGMDMAGLSITWKK
jgi:hypothetical protein